MLITLSMLSALAVAQTGAEIPLEIDAPPEFPRTVRRGDDICTQSLDDAGQIQSLCRPMSGAPAEAPLVLIPPESTPSSTPPPPATATTADEGPSAGDFAGTIGLLTGVELAKSAMAKVELYGDLGGRLSRSFALVAVLNVAVGFGTDTLVRSTGGIGLRIGGRFNGTIGAGISLLSSSKESDGETSWSHRPVGALIGGLGYRVWGPLQAMVNVVYSGGNESDLALGLGVGMTL